MEAQKERALPKLEKLRKLVRGKSTLLAQTHDYPDPDTIASALALCWLLHELEGIETTIGYGGIIGRAENKAMIKILGIKMKRTNKSEFKKHDLVALLDTQPGVGNHGVPVEQLPDIVLDHHFPRDLEGEEPAFYDVGGKYGATSTKVAELLMASELPLPKKIATALFYGVKTDTAGLGREVSEADLGAYLYLFPLAEPSLLAEIEHPQLPIEYFKVLNKAILRGKIYGNMIVSDLGEIYAPDLCAEVADRLLQVEGIRHALAVGWYKESLFLSLRTRMRSKNAGKILHGIICGQDLGTAGGHGAMAGARIPVDDRSQRSRADLRRKVLGQILRAFGQDRKRFQRFVPPKDAANASTAPPPPKNGNAKDDSGKDNGHSKRPAKASR